MINSHLLYQLSYSGKPRNLLTSRCSLKAQPVISDPLPVRCTRGPVGKGLGLGSIFFSDAARVRYGPVALIAAEQAGQP